MDKRLIDANALKLLLREYCIDGDEVVAKWYDIMGVDEVVDRAPTIGAVPRWIPCENRLPKVGREVLCQCRANIIEVLCLEENGSWENPSSFRHYLNSFVIAWMPLPDPYEEGGKDDE